MVKYACLIAAGVSIALPAAAQTAAQPQAIVVQTTKLEDRAAADRDSTERVQQPAPTRQSG